MAWGLVSIVRLPDFQVMLKIAGLTGGERTFDLAADILRYGQVPGPDAAEFMAKFREFGPGEKVFLIGPDTEGLNKDFQVAGFHPLAEPFSRGYTHIVYLRLD